LIIFMLGIVLQAGHPPDFRLEAPPSDVSPYDFLRARGWAASYTLARCWKSSRV